MNIEDLIFEISNQEIKMMKKTLIFQMTSKYKNYLLMLFVYYAMVIDNYQLINYFSHQFDEFLILIFLHNYQLFYVNYEIMS